jgi:ATP-binding cassette subfamily F protein 3
MEDYARFVLDRARAAARAPTQVRAEPAPAAAPPVAPARKAPTGNARRRAEAAEAALARASEALHRIDAILTDPATFARDPAGAAELGHKRAEAHAALEAAELEWLEAQEAYEQVKSTA